MNIQELENLSIKDAKGLIADADILREFLGKEKTSLCCPYSHLRGEGVFIRTVTHHYTGRLLSVHPTELVIDNAAWIADDGRFSIALATGELDEIEPFREGDKVVVGRGAILDCSPWKHALPKVAK